MKVLTGMALGLGLPFVVQAGSAAARPLESTTHWIGVVCLALLVATYVLVIASKQLRFRETRPVRVVSDIMFGVSGYMLSSDAAADGSGMAQARGTGTSHARRKRCWRIAVGDRAGAWLHHTIDARHF